MKSQRTLNCETLGAVTRTTVRLVFVAMLALLATQTPAVPVRGAAQYESVRRADSAQNQQTPFDLRRVPAVVRDRQHPSPYDSRLLTGPDTVLVFQLPPPAFSLAS
jgi:hypothetical protein